MNRRILGQKFYSRNAELVARELLGKRLIRRKNGHKKDYIITETEAYEGQKDKASHAFGGRRTERTKIMYLAGGHWYVYFTYGMHWMLNIVTGKPEHPAAVLIRGVKGINGPARLTKALGIARKISGSKAIRKSGLWIEDVGIKIKSKNIKKGPRIGVDYAGPYWSKKKWRFWL